MARFSLDVARVHTLEQLVAALPNTAVLVDAGGAVRASADPSGRTLQEGRVLADVLPAALVEAAQLHERVARAAETKRRIVLPRVDASIEGEARAFRVHVAPLDDAVLISIEELTEVIAAEARAKRTEHLAALGRMATTIAHEIGNPLGGIRAAAQHVESTLPPDDARARVLRQVQEQTARLGQITGDLLRYAELSAKAGVDVESTALDLGAVLTAIRASEAAVTASSGAGAALANAHLLTQVVSHLVHNAVQAGAHAIHVVAEGSTVKVHDDGPGIADDIRAHIFDPFFTTKLRGTGLGLPIAKKLVESMHGTLTLCDSPLGGAGFIVSLPPAPPSPSMRPNVATTANATNATGATTTGATTTGATTTGATTTSATPATNAAATSA